MKKLYLPLFFLGLAGLILSIFQIAGLKRSDCPTFVGLLAAAIVWWQAHLIKEQMQLQAIIELEKEWNSPRC